MGTEEHHIHISAKHSYLDFKLDEVWIYRDLILLFTRKIITVSYKQTILGPLWVIISPLLSSLVYMVLFGEIAKIGTDGAPKLLFYLTGMAWWGYFSACVNNNAGIFVNHVNLFGKVYFPRLTVPISNVLAAIFKFFIQMILVAALLVFYASKGLIVLSAWGIPIILLILVQLGLMGMGIGLWISGLTAKYRDLSVVFSYLVQMWMYVTPVVYPLSQVGNPRLQKLILINPLTNVIELYRWGLLSRGTWSIQGYLISWVFTLLVAVSGMIIFNKVERNFMDTV